MFITMNRIKANVCRRSLTNFNNVEKLIKIDGNKKMTLGGYNTYYGPGPTNTYQIDPVTEERRKPTLKDKEDVAKVRLLFGCSGPPFFGVGPG